MRKISEFRLRRHNASAQPHKVDGCYRFLQSSGGPERSSIQYGLLGTLNNRHLRHLDSNSPVPIQCFYRGRDMLCGRFQVVVVGARSTNKNLQLINLMCKISARMFALRNGDKTHRITPRAAGVRICH